MTSSTHNLVATTKAAASKREHFLKAPHEKKDYSDTLVSQYGSHFSNPDIRRLQTARPKTASNPNSMRAGKSSAAEVLNVVMSEKKNGAGELPKLSSNPGSLSMENKPTTEGDSQGSFISTIATTRAWDYVKAMTHPNTPLLLLSPLPAMEDSVLFAIDQSAIGSEFDNRTDQRDESSLNKRQREEAVIVQSVKGTKKIKSKESELAGYIKGEENLLKMGEEEQKSSSIHSG